MKLFKLYQKGFTLVEMAVVLVIVGLLLGGLIVPISAQVDIQGFKNTNSNLEDIKEALIGYAIINGRLPCPASSTSSGIEDPVGGGTCTHLYDGFLPAVTLGITPTDSSGYAIDGWGGNTSNRIRYAVTTSNTKAFTTASGMKTTGISTLSPDLHVCSSGVGITTTTCGTASSLTSTAVAVIYSVGKNAGTGGTNTDEAANANPNSANNDIVFVSHDPSGSGAAGGEFDDQMVWISFPLLINRMVSAGTLP
jgi:prepilin-type N-terminal cleavage/methylation domain-containing protein